MQAPVVFLQSARFKRHTTVPLARQKETSALEGSGCRAHGTHVGGSTGACVRFRGVARWQKSTMPLPASIVVPPMKQAGSIPRADVAIKCSNVPDLSIELTPRNVPWRSREAPRSRSSVIWPQNSESTYPRHFVQNVRRGPQTTLADVTREANLQLLRRHSLLNADDILTSSLWMQFVLRVCHFGMGCPQSCSSMRLQPRSSHDRPTTTSCYRFSKATQAGSHACVFSLAQPDDMQVW